MGRLGVDPAFAVLDFVYRASANAVVRSEFRLRFARGPDGQNLFLCELCFTSPLTSRSLLAVAIGVVAILTQASPAQMARIDAVGVATGVKREKTPGVWPTSQK